MLVGGAAVLTLAAAACSTSDADPDDNGDAPGVTTTTPTITATLAASGPVADWEGAVCVIIDDFRADYLATNDAAVPENLSLQERQVRTERLFPAQHAAARRAAERMTDVIPPPVVAELHVLLQNSYRQLADALEGRRDAVAIATTIEQVEASNPPVLQILNAALDFRTFMVQSGYCR